MNNSFEKNLIILLGAPRTGTKMLRELLKIHPEVDGVLYEQERVWTYGNKQRYMKSLTPEDLNSSIIEYIRRHFYIQWLKSPASFIVDKCVTNSLRLPYVRTIFPESPIIHITRDGRDAVCSIMDRWKSPFDYKYIFKYKAFPIKELPYFLLRQFNWYFDKIVHRRKFVRAWGPQFDDTPQLLKKLTLLEISAIQWKRCTDSVLSYLDRIPDNNYITIKYEDVVNTSSKTMANLFNFIGLDVSGQVNSNIQNYIQNRSVGRWKNILSENDIQTVMPIIEETLTNLHYI